MRVDTVVSIGQDRNDGVGGKGGGYVDLEIGTSASNAPDCTRLDSARTEGRDTMWKKVPSIKPAGESVREAFRIAGALVGKRLTFRLR